VTKFVGAHGYAPINIRLISAAKVKGDMTIQKAKPDPRPLKKRWKSEKSRKPILGEWVFYSSK
jgi:hypothetical protein